MEITPFPFLNQEDEYFQVFNLFQDMGNDGNLFSFDDTTNNGTNLKKRQRKEEEAIDKTGFGDILASLLLLDEEAKQEQERWLMESQRGKALLDANHTKKVQAMNDYNTRLVNHYTELDETDNLRSKRARKSASASAVVVAAGVGITDNVVQNDRGQQSGSGSGQQHRRLWVKERSTDWWDRFNHPDFPEDEFRREFRMSKATFDMICEELESAVTKKNTMLRDAIPVRQRVAVCIWRLATGEPLRLVSKRFGLGISTCHKLVLEVCSAIHSVLMPKFLHWPDENKLKSIKEEFKSATGIPNVGGTMYTTHIPIIAPKISVTAYFNKRHTDRNQKTSYSITVQGVVDPKGIFSDVCIGYPGSMNDDQVLEQSALFQRANKGLLKDVWIAGNSGYPLMDWVLVPYTHQNLTWAQHSFNEKIGEIQGVAKEAFARLKGRWACLQKRTEVKLQDLPVVLGACCVLHNICEMRNETMDPSSKFEIFDDEMVPENNLRSMSSIQARDQIAHNLLHHGHAGTSFL